MKIEVNQDRCPKNHACPAIRVCPVDAITQTGYGAPVIDGERCIKCGKCARVCPTGAIHQVA